MTTPNASTEYAPTPATVIDVPEPFVQFGDTSTGVEFGSQSFTDDPTKVVPAALDATVSLVSKFFVWAALRPPDDASGLANGTGSAWHIAPSSGVAA